MYTDKNPGFVCGNGYERRCRIVANFKDSGPQSRVLAFNVARGIRRAFLLFGLLAEIGTKRWPTLNYFK